MNEKNPVCYITYAVPLSSLENIPLPHKIAPAESTPPAPSNEAESSLYPPGFMPEWFFRGSFPEDDFE